MKFVFAFVFFGQVFLCNAGEVMTKAQSMAQVLDCARELLQIASTNVALSCKQKQDSVTAVVATLKNKDQLISFALICKGVLGAQNAGDELFDMIFDDAFWKAIKALSQFPVDSGLEALRKLDSSIKLDGGEKLTLDNYISKLQSNKRKGEHPAR